MPGFFELVNGFSTFIPLAIMIVGILAAYIIFTLLLNIFKRRLLKLAKTKKQISNIEIFSATIKYIFVFLLAISVVFYFSGDWTGLGLTLGLLSAAIGFALQRPIAGVAAWIMLVTRRPFEIGDRVIIGTVKGDVRDISLTHVTLKEIGGIVPTEENSGRTILIPNNILFEQNIINYTQQDEFILNQVEVSITYESNLNKAIKTAEEAAKKITKEFSEIIKKEPYVRVYFQPSGVTLSARFFVPVKRMVEVTSSVTKEIYDRFMKEKDIQFAYPHTEVILNRKGK